jgi:formate hydrogenlyase subunit 6/NADH:ubiquinone oxidoreductase subunit I
LEVSSVERQALRSFLHAIKPTLIDHVLTLLPNIKCRGLKKWRQFVYLKYSKERSLNLFTKSARSLYPYIEPQLPENSRGRPVFDVTLCVGCGLCSKDCTAKAIEMIEFNGKKRPQFRLDKCVFCYQCAETCRKGSIDSSTFFAMATSDKSTLKIKPQLTITT